MPAVDGEAAAATRPAGSAVGRSPRSAVVGSARLTMWVLMIIPWLCCHCVRRGLPLLIEFIVRDLVRLNRRTTLVQSQTTGTIAKCVGLLGQGYNDIQKAQLLGSFFPGCNSARKFR